MRFAFVVIGFNMVIFTLFRAIFWALFRSTAPETLSSEFLWALYLGFKFDLRLSLLICLPVLVFSWIPGVNFVRSYKAKWTWLIYLVAMEVFLILMYFVDLGHYDYLHDRLNGSAIDHILSPAIALQMVWETYPVILGVLALSLFAVVYGWLLNRFAFRKMEQDSKPFGRRLKVATVVVALIFYGLGIHGKLSQYPLRWSEAYFSTNPFVSALSLNPVLFFFDTFGYRKASFDKEEVRKHYPLMADLLSVDRPDPKTLNFSRYIIPEKKLPGTPNIVLILLESFAGFKVGALGNGLNPTPHFDSIARNSIFFKNFFVTRPPTARAVFTAMLVFLTSTPHSASTIPHCAPTYDFDALKDTKTYFFGSANWGNIRGILAHNIDGLKIYEEGYFSSLPDDAWGISDFHLFEEANQILRKQDKPFFALIHTAGNHRPYTIPKDRGDFKEAEESEVKLIENGFDSLKDYNGMRFLDHCIGHFFRLASKEDYFKRTIFCLFADHGTVANQQIPWDKLTLTSHHVPLAIYAPGYFSEGREINTTGSLVDILPTLLGLTGIPYLNTTLGRDLLVERPKEKHFAYIENIYRGVLDDEFLLLIAPRGRQRLYRYRSNSPLTDVKDQNPEKAAEMARLSEAINETSKYLLFHNRPNNPPVMSK
jgi:phosphoglycerol transferase MdoB-like AlkP superfamily enzyme